MLTQMLKELEKIEKFSLQQVAEDLVRKIISNLDSFKTTPVGDIPADMLIFFFIWVFFHDHSQITGL